MCGTELKTSGKALGVAVAVWLGVHPQTNVLKSLALSHNEPGRSKAALGNGANDGAGGHLSYLPSRIGDKQMFLYTTSAF